MTPQRGAGTVGRTATLAAKLHPPLQRQRLVERRRLISRLEKGLGGRFCLLKTPAGYGKTTLLAQFWQRLEASGRRLAWLTLDENDQDPFQFLAGLTDALRHAGIPLTSLAHEANRVTHQVKPRLALQSTLREIESCGDRIVLFLDDYHQIESPENDALIHTLLTLQPANLYLVLATRTKPGFPISKSRVTGEAQELTETDLKFDRRDLDAFMGDVLDSDQISTLSERTEGWPVALQLVRLWIRDGTDAEALLRSISGTVDEIAGYLAEQVFLDLPVPLQNFLVETSILDRINGELADAVCGRDGGWQVLDHLDRMSAFIFPLGRDRSWFRPHQLFADFLRNQLKRRGGAAAQELHGRASLWFEAHGDLIEAVQHARKADDLARAVRLAETAGGVRFPLFEGLPAFKRLLHNIPKEAILRQPRLRAAEALMLMKDGKLAEGQRAIAEVKAGLSNGDFAVEPEDMGAVERDILIADALATGYCDDEVTQAMIGKMEALTATVAQSDHWFRGFLNNLLCVLHFRRGNLVSARVAAQAGLNYYREAGAIYGMIFMYLHGGMLALTRGGLDEAIADYRAALALCERHMISDTELRALAEIFLAEAFYERGQADEASELIFHALPIAEEAEGWVEVFVAGYRTASALAFGRGGMRAAAKILDQGVTVARARGLERLESYLLVRRLQYLIQDGQIEEAARLTGEAGLSPDGAHFANRRLFGWREKEDAQLILARLALAEDRPERAGGLLDDLEAACAKNDQSRRLVSILVLHALKRQATGDMDGAAAALKRALALSMEEGFRQVFVDEGPPVEDLLKSLVTHVGVSGMPQDMLDWVAEILVTMGEAGAAKPKSLVAEIFTEREQEILAQLKLGGSNKVIARRLDITDNAVKFHLKNIYRKLGVNGRKLALAVAEKRGLIAESVGQPGPASQSYP